MAPAQRNPRIRDLMPPFSLPREHFVAALAWLGLGAAGLLLVAPDLARGAFLAHRTIAVVHCFTLGWITTSVFGALYQVYPVALGLGARSEGLGHLTFWILQAGVATLVSGAWAWKPMMLAAGWILLLLAAGGLAWNLVSRSWGAPRGRVIGWYVGGGLLGLVLALLTIAASIGTFAGWWGVDRLGVLTAHVHLATIGFATVTVIGIGGKLLPMFLLARDVPAWPLLWIGPLLAAGLLSLSVGAIWQGRVALLAGGGITAAAILLYLYVASRYYRLRTRRQLDPGLSLTAVAHAFLAAATVLGLGLMLGIAQGPRLLSAYGLLGILGWLSLFVAGVYFRILPLLTWMHRFSGRIGRPDTPKVGDLVMRRLCWASHGLLATGVATLTVSVAAGSPAGAATGATMFALGVGGMLIQYASLAGSPRRG
ncbi:MAG: hypothetical protein V3S52_02655 [Gemmatimonadota bacterium]